MRCPTGTSTACCPLPLVALLLAGPALAQLDPDPDGVGFYFDTGGLINCVEMGMLTEGAAYLLLTHASAPAGVGGFETHVEAAGSVIILGALACPGYSWAYRPDHACGLAPPLPWAPAIVLVEATFLVIGPGPSLWPVEPHPLATIPGHPAYAAADDLGDIRPLFPSAGRDETGAWRPTAVVNGSCVVSATGRTWGVL